MNLDSYLKRFNGRPPIISVKPARNLSGIIVIPCYREPDWKTTLDCLAQCESPTNPIEVLVILNHSEVDCDAVKAEQHIALQSIREWSIQHGSHQMQFHAIDASNLPKKHAGVGLARKIGMDEGLHRLNGAGNLRDGFIACLDADCRCQANYLLALEDHFQQHPKTPGCSLYFEHPMDGDLTPETYDAVIKYELHLRYYVEALRFASFPYAYHTVGSSMAVRPFAYMSQGGMNRKKAGEDFYFLNKIIPMGNFTEINDSVVIPSPRTSDRVPFGTGRAVAKYYGQSHFPTYAWSSILELKSFFTWVHQHDPFTDKSNRIPDSRHLPGIMSEYMDATNGWDQWQKCIASTCDLKTYRRRFFQWFDAFQCMKCLHFMRDKHHGEMEVTSATKNLFSAIGLESKNEGMDTIFMLKKMRSHQRKGWSFSIQRKQISGLTK